MELCNGEAYWAVNVFRADGTPDYARVYKDGSNYMVGSTGERMQINDLCHDPESGIVYAAGSKTVGGVITAVVWKGSDENPYFTFSNGSYSSSIKGVCVGDGSVYSAGTQYHNATDFHGAIWRNGSELYNLGTSVIINDIAYYDGSVYTVGLVAGGSSTIIKVWRDNVVLYTLTQTNSMGFKILIDAGDIYVCGYEAFDLKVWKNGATLHEITGVGSGAALRGVAANSMGVYYSGRTSSDADCKIWKDGYQMASLSDCEFVNDMYVEEVCEDEGARSLPFEEGFENGLTNWACWTAVDVDDDNLGRPSYWDRLGKRMEPAFDGDYVIRHRYNVNHQEGWLISPRLFLQPGRDHTRLTFMTREGGSSDYTYEGVWVSTTDKSLNSFTEIWTQDAPSEAWSAVTVDLNQYQGEAVYIAFKYSGTDGHNWFIDNVKINETWNPCAVANIPYNDSFNTELSWCWYILDMDQSGGQACWAYSYTEQCVDHVWGRPGEFQEGWLISKDIVLPADHRYVLTFDHKNVSSGDDMRNSVWIAVDKSGEPSVSDYTKIWEDTEFPGTWTKVTILLPDYAGHSIRIAFKYEGTYAHAWSIDNVNVDEGNGVVEIQDGELAVYPNPATDRLRIVGLEAASEVQVFNTLGADGCTRSFERLQYRRALRLYRGGVLVLSGLFAS